MLELQGREAWGRRREEGRRGVGRGQGRERGRGQGEERDWAKGKGGRGTETGKKRKTARTES